MHRLLRLLPLAFLTLLLTACVDGLDYELVIDVHADGSYNMAFEGTIGIFALREAQMEGDPYDEVEEFMEEIDLELEGEPTVEAWEYRGDGVYLLRGRAAFDELDARSIFDMFVEVAREPGQLTFTTPELEVEYLQLIERYGWKQDGLIIVRSDARILGSNGRVGPRGHYWDQALLEVEGMRITLATP